MILPPEYYQNRDTLFLGKDLIGKYLFTEMNGTVTGGMITETESYLGESDRACHAYSFRKTKRNEVMYQAGGLAYVYICYGLHALFNIVTNVEDAPHAILVRALKPEYGIMEMEKRRKGAKNLANGPGCLTQALGIGKIHNGEKLTGPLIWLEDRKVSGLKIKITPRIGIDYAGEDILKPYRFVV